MMRTPLVLSLLLVAGCRHSEPPASGGGDLELPFEVSEPIRLTYSAGFDRGPSWSTEPGRIVYVFDRDRTSTGLPKSCVGDLAASGGSRGWEVCDEGAARRDTSTTAEWPARRSDGAVAFIRRRWSPYGISPYFSDLALHPAGEGQAARTIIPIPYYSSPTARTHQGISHLQWLDATHLLYLALGVIRSLNDNVETGLEIVILTPADSLAGVTVVPGTLYASSVDVGENNDTIYYTMGGDSRVYRRTLSTGVVETVADFGALGIARDVKVRAGRLVAVVGGNVSFGPHANLGMAQYDYGGPIYSVGISSWTPTLVTQSDALYRHPALAPDGSRVVAERNFDLWSIVLP